MTPEKARELCILAHKGQWRRPVVLPQGPGTLITDEMMSNMMYGNSEKTSMLGKPHILQNGSKLLYKKHTKYWYLCEPYHIHPIAVADMLTTDEEKIVAYLHDVIEDTDYKLSNLISNKRIYNKTNSFFISETIWYALTLCTKVNEEKYEEYINRLTKIKLHYTTNRARTIVIKVKIADMFHNISNNPSKTQKLKYYKGLKFLLNSL